MWGPDAENFVGEFLPAKRFAEKTLEGREADHRVFFGGEIVSGDHDEGGVGNQRGGLADEFEAVELRHVIIRDDDAGVELGQAAQGIERAREGVDGTVEILHQHLGEEIGVGLLVVDNDDGSGDGGTHDGAGKLANTHCKSNA